jgi:uncharacterized protein (TIGR03790 family)
MTGATRGWWCLAILLLMAGPATGRPQLILPHTGLSANELAVVINDDDPLSRRIGEYYRDARKIPPGNVIRVRFPPGRSVLPAEEFAVLKGQIDRATPAHVQAYAVAWTQPYRVGCMSLTSALAFGFDPAFCSSACGATRASPYFDSASRYPALDHAMRPAMMLAGTGFEPVRRLIDRGLAADHGFPVGKVWLLSTSDKARNVRAANFERTAAALEGVFPIEVHEGDAPANPGDVLGYFTGLASVPGLASIHFVPGALADHLTSFGGQLTDSSQMSSLRWLEAGATASYGTVVEPCSHPQKFPLPAIALFHYAAGASAVEAYWKSVAWPGEGVFIGDPLARPFAPALSEVSPGRFELKLFSPRAGRLSFEHSLSPMGPFRRLPQQHAIHRGLNVLQFALPGDMEGYARVQW